MPIDMETLKRIAYGASFKERIFAFASLSNYEQRMVLDSAPGTIADGAHKLLNPLG